VYTPINSVHVVSSFFGFLSGCFTFFSEANVSSAVPEFGVDLAEFPDSIGTVGFVPVVGSAKPVPSKTGFTGKCPFTPIHTKSPLPTTKTAPNPQHKIFPVKDKSALQPDQCGFGRLFAGLLANISAQRSNASGVGVDVRLISRGGS
jgi:hypothetical protein